MPTARIKGFGETLEVLIIASLFILLGALVEIDALRAYVWQILALIVVLVVIVRPASAALALVRSKLPWRDRALIAGMDPRGIVAAATAAQFSVTLTNADINSDFMLPVAFGVILGTGIVYGLGAKPLARSLGVALPPARGVGIVGDAPWLADLALQLHQCGVSVLLVTADLPASTLVTEAGLPTISFRESEDRIKAALEQAELSEVLISNEPGAALTMAMAMFVERLVRQHVLRLPEAAPSGVGSLVRAGATARPFAPGITRSDIEQRVEAGAIVQTIEDFSGADVLPLAVVAADGSVELAITDPAPRAGDTVIALVGGPAWPIRT